MEPFQAIEQLTFVRVLKASFVAYPVVNAVHIAAIGALLTSVTLLDLRILGALRTLPERPFMVLMRRTALLAFGVAALSGLLLFSVRASHYAQLPVFLAKMVLIALAGTNFVVFAAVECGKGHRRALRLLAVLSIMLWCAVLLCGRFIGFL
ncbi:hypothetical protein J1C56_26090 [Aminobacter anthyllidis]|uniref:DUF2214 domain-containing protein n=1 Tax=Aminobacter anthyllidis TaxID=1035067 RepID=A0A9X1AG43_9HYPH|nr:hypothetical protein [Aminobacter anthyllidis]MBT1159052.1 hypothetical protein [Aminobacter anthyllidis]